jgi:hypothetical protein
MNASFRAMAILLAVATPASLQDRPGRGGGGTPVALSLMIEEAPYPWYVASRPAYLCVTVVDGAGGTVSLNTTATLQTTDPKSKLNGVSLPIVNRIGMAKVRWYTPGTHEITAATPQGLQGKISGIKVRALPADTTVVVERPAPWPSHVWGGGVFRLAGRVTGGGRPLYGIEVRVKTSHGVIRNPHDLYASDGSGAIVGIIFPPDFVCPTEPANGDGNGDGNGHDDHADVDTEMSLAFYIDLDGDGLPGDGDIIVEPPPITLVDSCPQVLLPASLEMLKILEAGGDLEPPGDGGGGDVIVAAASTKTKPNPNPNLEKFKSARRFLEERVIGTIRDGKWNGRFSKIREGTVHVADFLRPIGKAKPVVDRLDCAALRLERNPDVIGLKLHLQPNRGVLGLAPDFSGEMTVQNLGEDNAVLSPSAFGHCNRPRLDAATVLSGPATAQVSDADALTLSYRASGRGFVQLSVTVAYESKEATIVVPGDGDIATVPVSQVIGDGSDLVGEPLRFTFRQLLRIRQR